jgi:hypothetical protein
MAMNISLGIGQVTREADVSTPWPDRALEMTRSGKRGKPRYRLSTLLTPLGNPFGIPTFPTLRRREIPSFQTGEGIYAALLLKEWSNLLAHLEVSLKGAKGTRQKRSQAFLQTYITHVIENPQLLRLDALAYGVLERNLEG